jgi:hypothetical protein
VNRRKGSERQLERKCGNGAKRKSVLIVMISTKSEPENSQETFNSLTAFDLIGQNLFYQFWQMGMFKPVNFFCKR